MTEFYHLTQSVLVSLFIFYKTILFFFKEFNIFTIKYIAVIRIKSEPMNQISDNQSEISNDSKEHITLFTESAKFTSLENLNYRFGK